MATRKSFREHKQLRRDTATVRLEARSKRSAEEQLRALDERLGAGIGAIKERIRLHQEMFRG